MKTKVYSDEQLSLFPLYLSTVGVEYKQYHLKRPAGYKNHQIFLVNSGNGFLKIGEKCLSISANDLFYIAANIPHEYYGEDDSFKTTYVSFFGEGFEGIKKYYALSDFGVYKNKSIGAFKSSAENLYDSVDGVHELSTLCSLTFTTVISYFDEACKREYAPIEKAYNFIEENYSKPISLDDILTVYNYSKTKLCRDFKEKYNMTVFAMLTNVRLRHAHNMLSTNPYLPLKSVACFCGFNDTSYFCKMYKRFYGYSPKAAAN